MNRIKRWMAAGADRWEGRTQVAIMLAIGGAGAAMSWSHVRDVAAGHGQAGWRAWAVAIVLELAAVGAGLDMRSRRRRGQRVWPAALTMSAAVVLSLGAQLVSAEASPVGWLAAAVPTVFFLAMVKMALARMSVRPAVAEVVAAGPDMSLPVPADTARDIRPDTDTGHPSGATGHETTDNSTDIPRDIERDTDQDRTRTSSEQAVAAVLALAPRITTVDLAKEVGLSPKQAGRLRKRVQPERVKVAA